MAYHIFDSAASARRIVTLARSVGTSGWQSLLEDPVKIEQIEQSLEWIRVPSTDTLTTLFAVSQLRDILGHTFLWSQIENILLTQTFCWPLFVCGTGEQALGISVPVAVDIDFEASGPTGRVILGDRRSKENQGGGIDPSQWQEHLTLAMEAAKELWFAKHKNHGIYTQWWRTRDDFRWKVAHANVRLEFYWANCILGSIPVSPSEGSADAYFAMVVLARLLGRRSHLSSVVTGVIGEKSTEEDEENSQWEEQDYLVEPPGDVVAKLRYLFSARTFERVALPKGSENKVQELFSEQGIIETNAEENAPSIVQTAEVAYGAKLSHFADIVQTDGWRQYRYIRCPELQWALHEKYYAKPKRPGLLGMFDLRVRKIRDLLSNNNTQILDLQNELYTTPRAVASALWHINMNMRLHLYPVPPMFSSLFIRVTYDQQDTRFWESFWRACGAPIMDFEQFHQAPSPVHAATILARVLNHFQPLEKVSLSQRTPDLIVIVGAEHLSRSIEQAADLELRPLAVMPILREL